MLTFDMLDKLRSAAIQDNATGKVSNGLCDEICDWCETMRRGIGGIPRYCTSDDCPGEGCAILEETDDGLHVCPERDREYYPILPGEQSA